MEIIELGASLKNAHIIDHDGCGYMAATDMLTGGVAIYRGTDGGGWRKWLHCYRGWTMMWAPHLIQIDGQWWCYVCDTAGGDPEVWWEHMLIYRFKVFFAAQDWQQTLDRVHVENDDDGLIDPFLFRYGDWWYLFCARLWDDGNRRWWDPSYSVSQNPAGPFRHVNYLGIGDNELRADPSNIDEAFKIYDFAGQLMAFWSAGDSGTNGYSMVGAIYTDGRHPEGWHKLRVGQPQKEIKAFSALLTAPWWYHDRLYVTTREYGWTGKRDKFKIAVM